MEELVSVWKIMWKIVMGFVCVRCLMLSGMADARLRKDVGLIRRLLMLAMGKLYACARMDILDIKFPIDA